MEDIAMRLIVPLLCMSLAIASAAQAGLASIGTGLKVGLVLSAMQEERFQRDKRIFEETVRKLGGHVVFASCNNSEQSQASEVDNLLSQGVDVLVIQPVNGDTASAFVKRAKDTHIPVVAYDRLIKNAPIDAYVTEDSFRAGQLQAEAAVKFTQGKGNYVLLLGQAGHPLAEGRAAGALSVLKKHPDIKVVVKQYHPGWSADLAAKTTEGALALYRNNIQAVIAGNSLMAHGAVQALEEQKLAGRVFVAGADADLVGIRDLVADKQQIQILVSVNDMARRAAEVAFALGRKQDFEADREVDNGTLTVKTVSAPVFPLDKSQIEARIIRAGFHTREAVYGKSAGAASVTQQ
jgi:D-xylose transport system substrate-binding protein